MSSCPCSENVILWLDQKIHGFPENTPLWQKEGLGDFYEFIYLKIPLHPPFPKGEYYIFMIIFMPLCEPKARVGFTL
jgi:hypothetical protein